MKQKILVGRGFSQYNVLCRATDEICQGFLNLGYEVEIVDFHDINAENYFFRCLEHKEDYLFYFSMQALYWDEEKTNYIPLQNMPRIGWIVDDPIFHDERLCGTTGHNANVLIVRDSHVNIIQHNYPHIDFVDSLYHGGFTCPTIIPYAKRQIDVFFPGTYTSIEKTEQMIDEIDGIYHQVAVTLKQRITGKNLSHSWRDELKNYFSSLQIDVTEKEFHALEYIMRPLDLYQRAYMRTHIIDNLLKSGIEVTVVGAGWNEYNGEGKEHLHILSSSGIDIDQTIKLMGDSKIVINNTNIMDGLHERILSAMLAQSVCVTNSYNLLNNFFQNNRDFITYSLDELELLPNIISAILTDSQKSEQIAKNGYQAALKSHTWVHRGEQIVSWALNHHPFTY